MRRVRGFSLLEIAVVLVILTVLLSGLLLPLGAQVEMRQYGETRANLAEVREALIGYALTNGRLPCPADLGGNGVEKPCTTSADVEGGVPWASLGVRRTDAWDQELRLRVSSAFLQTPFTAAAAGSLQVCNAAGCPATGNATGNVAAVVWSSGKNRGLCGSATGCPDEAENANRDDTFVTRVVTPSGAATEFDDVVVWLPAPLLIARVCAVRPAECTPP